MAMRCPKCGNEVAPDEAFCGQCGTPTTPPAPPTEMVQTPQRSGLLSSYNTNRPSVPSPSHGYNTGMVPPPHPYNTNAPPTSGGAVTPQQSAVRPVGPQQQAGFYQDATEAM